MMCTRSSPRRGLSKGFTLLELLTVIGIIIMLIAILAPGVIRAVQYTTAARCAANLREISKAIALFRTDNRENNLISGVWQATLKPYVEGKDDIFVCTEFAEDAQEVTEIALTNLVFFRTRKNANTYWDIELTENPYVVKLSDPQYQEARDLGWFCNNDSGPPDPCGHGANHFHNVRDQWPYAPTPDGVYWLCIEDHGGDWDFKDIMVKITDNHDGTIKLEMTAGNVGHHNTLRSKNDDFGAVHIAKNTTVPLEVLVPTGECTTSYGMHAGAEKIRYDGTKVLVMDYHWTVARPTDVWDYSAGVPSFARHMGKMNVLFGGGEVILMRPEEVDPADPIIRDSRWHYTPDTGW